MGQPCNGVELIGHIWGVDGFSETNRELALALREKGFPIRVVPLHAKNQISCLAKLPNDVDMKIESLCQQQLSNNIVSVHHYSIQGMRFINQAARGSVHYGVYETNGFPLVWKYMMNKASMFKETWTPSSFNEQTLKAIGLPVYRVPHGVNINRFTPDGLKYSIDGMEGFNFLSCMTWKKLKGYDVLLKGYLEEFASGKDNVSLILKAYIGSGNILLEKAQIAQYIQEAKRRLNSKAKILLIVEPLGYDEITNLHRTADCFVLPTRGEGWGKNIMESMASEVPVIVTAASGHMDYVNKHNSLLIDCKQEEIADIEWLLKEPVSAGHKWFEPDLQSLKKQMRWAYEHPKELKQLGKQARLDILLYEWSKVADKFIEQVQQFGVRNE